MMSTSWQADGVPNQIPRCARDDKRLGHGTFIDAVHAIRQCQPEGPPALTASYTLCSTDPIDSR